MSADNLTKREHVAALVLQSLITVYGGRDKPLMQADWQQGLAKSAVLYADELLSVLGNEGPKS
jgi:hypothetical protein